MLNKFVLIFITAGSGLVFSGLVGPGKFKPAGHAQQPNQPPVVKLISPKNNSTFEWDTQIAYEITVNDKEDGNSKYDEISAKEVLLEVKRIKDKSKISAMTAMQNDAPGLAVIRTSNCFNCHSFNEKAIGPSFYEISKRYPITLRNVDSLAKHVKFGSTGVWGKEKMPTHPELSAEQARSATQWILKFAASPDVNYYFGTAGTFKIKRPASAKAGDSYLLIGSYIDHGLKNSAAPHLKGQDAAVITSR